MSKLANNTAIYAIGDIVPKLLNLVTFPVLTSNLSTTDFGIINYINSVEAFLTILTFLGLKTYYLVYYYKVESEEDRKKLLGNLSIFIIVFNIIVTSIMLFGGSFIFGVLGSGEIEFYPYICIGIICNFFSLLSVLPGALYRVQENPLPLTVINTVKGLIIMVLTCIYVLKLPSVLTVLYIRLIVTILFGILFLYITFKNSIFQIDLKQIKQALAFSLPLVPGDIAYYLSSMSDRILIEKYISVDSLGIYSMAATLAGMLNILAYGAYKAFEPFFFKTYGSPSFILNFEKIRSYLLYLLLPLGLCLVSFSKEIVHFFSSSGYYDAYLYVPALTLGVILSAIGCMYTTVLTAQAKTKISAMISIFCACLSVIINMTLLSVLGIWSAAIANILIYLFTLYMSKYFIHIKTKDFPCVLSVFWFCVFSIISCYILKIDNLYTSIIYKIAIIIIYIIFLGVILRVTPLHIINMIYKKKV